MKKLKKVCISVISLAVILSSTSSFAKEKYTLTSYLTEDYIKWEKLSDKEKEKAIMPRVSTLDISSDKVSNLKSVIGLRQQLLRGNFEKNAKIALVGINGYDLPQYNLNDKIGVTVKHQGYTSECWAFSTTSVLETNLELTQNIKKTFSPRHMDYSLSRTFLDGINENTLNREVGDGGLAAFGMAYLASGKGAVLESNMPFVDNEDKISLSELNKPVDTIATEIIEFPSVHKEYINGQVKYTNGGRDEDFKQYTDEEIKSFRNDIKNHIVNYGAVSAVTAANHNEYYNNPNNVLGSVAYFCNDNTVIRDHAVTIVGWNDNYSKENFTGSAKPSSDGAYICLNSYGKENFDNGYIYISYEDSLIETYLYGIKSSKEVDYDNIYQYNPTGEDTNVGINNIQKGYIAEIFNRDASKKETLKYVGVNIPEKMSLKIYVNADGNNPSLSSCKLVATTGMLSPGYYRIPIEEINLTGNDFSVVIEENSSGRFAFSIEIPFNNSIYSTITGNPGKSLYSINGTEWAVLSEEKVSGFNMKEADMTIKAFTVNGYIKEQEDNNNENDNDNTNDNNKDNNEQKDDITISSNKYTIKENDIFKIDHNTTIEKFKRNITTNSEKMDFYDSSDKKLEDKNIIKTGTKLKLSDESTYILVVRGDINCDGTCSLVDLSKIVAHYGDINKYGLTDSSLKAADLNVDGKVSLIDISQMVELLGHI